MINIAERLKVEAQVKSRGSEDAAPSMQPTGAEQADNKVAAYPAKNLILDGGRYFVGNHEK